MLSVRVRRNCCGRPQLGNFWHDITDLTSCLMSIELVLEPPTGDVEVVERMEIGRRVHCADIVESQHRIEFVQLQSRRTRLRKRSVQRTAPTEASSRRLQNWRSSSRQQRMKTSVWRQKHSKWTVLRNWMLCLMLYVLKVKQLTWMSCKLSWILATSIFLSRCTMLHCVRKMMPSERRNKMPSPGPNSDLQLVETIGEEAESETCTGSENYRSAQATRKRGGKLGGGGSGHQRT